MHLYIASSWRNIYYPEVVTALRAAGHEVYDFRNPPSGDPGFHCTDVDEACADCTPRNIRRYKRLCRLNGFEHVKFYKMKLANNGKFELEATEI